MSSSDAVPSSIMSMRPSPMPRPAAMSRTPMPKSWRRPRRSAEWRRGDMPNLRPECPTASRHRYASQAAFSHCERLSARRPCSAEGRRFGPAVAEAHEILDFGESFIAVEELLAYATDNSSNVYSITVCAASSDEALVVYAVVDRSIGHPAARFRRQEMDDVVLDQGEADVEIVPICPTDIRV